MIDFSRNNLDKSNSPYLLQHKSNPVWWQEWSPAVIQQAVSDDKPLFVSVGYATCHWCHVMASEAFSDQKTADYLNRHFISIKVDREQRPDIDQFLMHFLNALAGNGGWPLNAFLTPDIRPFYALTYAPVRSAGPSASFLSITKKISDYYKAGKADIPPFAPDETSPPVAEERVLLKGLFSNHDPVHGGFGNGQKFPPHATLLYLLYFLCVENNPDARAMCKSTLDAMRLRGLSDHLQGGIFRYCVDPVWTIPHFEKMLYDQVMALWCYALAYRVLTDDGCKRMAVGILQCLEECFEEDGLFISGHDADTAHEEGATYIWGYEELKTALLPDEFVRFSKSYEVTSHGNFEGKIHLIRKNDAPLEDIEKKLLRLRLKRLQPEPDGKILCGMNALAAIALLQAGRNMKRPELEEKSAQLVRRLIKVFWNGESLGHSFYRGVLQNESFLFDAGAMLTAISMLWENDESWGALMAAMASYVESFREGEQWVESRAADFRPIYASWFDHPVPSSVSLAEMGLTRAALLAGKHIRPKSYRGPFTADFFNVSAMLNNGLFHVVTSEGPLPWSALPPNSLQIRGKPESDCYRGTCRALSFGSQAWHM